MTTRTLDDVMDKVDAAKLQLMTQRSTTFFSVLLAMMQIVEEKGKTRAWIDGKRIGLNPDFVEEISIPQLIGTLLHEIPHVALEHISLWMNLKLDRKLTNIAGDLYINHWIKSLGFELPEDHLDEEWSHGMGFLEIYEELEKRQKNNPSNDPGQGPTIPGLPEELDDFREPEGGWNESEKEEILNKIIQAAQEAEKRGDPGSVPGSIKAIIERVTNPKLPWDVLLMKYASEYSKDDYSWRRPNRRYMASSGMYLPCLRDETVKKILWTMDTSGSVTDEILGMVLNEGDHIRSMLNPEEMVVVSWDTKIQAVNRLQSHQSMDDVTVTGRGGTDIEPVLQFIADENPEFALIFTDGYFGYPDMSHVKHIDLIWLIFDNDEGYNWQPPDNHGKVICFDEFLKHQGVR